MTYNYSGDVTTFTNLYECVNEDGCAGVAPGQMKFNEWGVEYTDADGNVTTGTDWWLSRAIGDIVTDYTSVDCFDYTDYMYILTGDTVCVGDMVYECVDGTWCSNSPPGEDQSGLVWAPVKGEANSVPLEEGEEVEALPWWIYTYEPDLWNLGEGDVFQVGGMAYECTSDVFDSGYDCVTALYYATDYYGDLDYDVFYGYGF